MQAGQLTEVDWPSFPAGKNEYIPLERKAETAFSVAGELKHFLALEGIFVLPWEIATAPMLYVNEFFSTHVKTLVMTVSLVGNLPPVEV